jgi:hypothetical protein
VEQEIKVAFRENRIAGRFAYEAQERSRFPCHNTPLKIIALSFARQ